MGSHFILPDASDGRIRDAWRLTTSSSLATMTRAEMERVHKLQQRAEMAKKPRAADVKSGAFLQLCFVRCSRCGVDTGWGIAEMNLCCGSCGKRLWAPKVFEAADAVRRMTGDFDAFNEMLRLAPESLEET